MTVVRICFVISMIIGHVTPGVSQLINETNKPLSKVAPLSESELRSWFHSDYQIDTIPGISLNKLYLSGLLNRENEEVIVAVLDTKIDVDHEDLVGNIWVNTDEIPGNKIDDDNNGYIDDINGWDFLSDVQGDYITYQSFEVVRIIRALEDKYEGVNLEDIDKRFHTDKALYENAKIDFKNQLEFYKSSIIEFREWVVDYNKYDSLIAESISHYSYDAIIIDSLIQFSTDSTHIAAAEYIKISHDYDWTPENLDSWITWFDGIVTNGLNINHDERSIIGDDPHDIRDAYYGSPDVDGIVPFNHSISVSGAIGANRANQIGAVGFSDNLSIMPLVMVASGDEYDKDIALAIRYAVDNGAKVINMSWGKKFSIHEDWVSEAIKYAASHDVLIVHGAGNDSANCDSIKYYPNDNIDNHTEFVDNFITVGASSFEINENLIPSFSNYGKSNVDVFAPGVDIYTTKEGNEYQYADGTSLATPVVSGIAGLLRSYFPELSASQTKQIILASGITYDIDVNIDFDENENPILKNFTQLSKTGKIVNAYNAFIMAQEFRNQKSN